jgi:hypothetical protein
MVEKRHSAVTPDEGPALSASDDDVAAASADQQRPAAPLLLLVVVLFRGTTGLTRSRPLQLECRSSLRYIVP